MKALQNTDVPVPRVHLLCDDDAVIGTMFYVMDYVDGRVFTDRLLPGCTPQQRREMYDAMQRRARAGSIASTIAPSDSTDFGKPTGYVARQVSRWSKQYLASRIEDTPAMNQLMEWLPAQHAARRTKRRSRTATTGSATCCFIRRESRVVAVLDWELSTIGHPLSDLAYCCSAYHICRAPAVAASTASISPRSAFPTEAQFLDELSSESGTRGHPALDVLHRVLDVSLRGDSRRRVSAQRRRPGRRCAHGGSEAGLSGHRRARLGDRFGMN